RPEPVAGAAALVPRGRLRRARQPQALHGPAPRARRGHGRRTDRPRADQVVHGARHRHARGLRPDGELRPRHRDATAPDQAGNGRHPTSRHRGPCLAPGRNLIEGPARVPGLLQESRAHRADGRRRLAAYGGRRAHGRRRLRDHHRPHEGHHHHRRRQEHHAVGDREPAQVLAVHLGRRGDRRPAQVPLVSDHDRPRDGRAVRPGAERPLQQLRLALPRPRGAGPDLGRDRARQPSARSRGDDQEVPPDRAAAHGRGRGADAHHEAQANVREPQIQGRHRQHVRRGVVKERVMTRTLLAVGAGLTAVALAAGALAQTDNRGVTKNEIVLGMHTDLSGPAATYGVSSSNAVKMRFDEINDKGGIHGRKIRLVVEDTQYQVPRAVQAGTKLINRDKIFAMVAPLGTPMNNALFKDQFDAGVPNLFPLSAARSMYEPFNKLKFYGAASYVDQVRAAINYFVTKKGKKAVCAMYQDTDFGKEVLDGVQMQVDKMKIKLAETTTHKPTDQDFTAQITRLKAAGCDLVVLGTIVRDSIVPYATARKIGWTDVDFLGSAASYDLF